MALSRFCAEKRREEENLKTQIRFGHNDVEIYVKRKGENEAYKKVSLNKFMGTEKLPKFDMSVIWKKQRERPERRRYRYASNKDIIPSMKKHESPAKGKRMTQTKAITRQNSTEAGTESKRARKEDDKSSSESESGSSEDENMSGTEVETFATPKGDRTEMNVVGQAGDGQ